MEIHEWLRLHPAIKVYFIERTLGIPRGTIRLTKPVPEKYLEAIIGLLSAYGYGEPVVEKEVFKPAEKPIAEHAKRRVIRMVTRIDHEVKKAYVFGAIEGKVFVRDNDIQDGAQVVFV